MMTNTTSIASVSINTITIDDIVNEVIDVNELATLAEIKDASSRVASIADAKKGTYAMVNAHLSEYFVNAYYRVSGLNNKTAWAEREVICSTMESEYYKKAFGSDDAYAKEIGKSASNLSKIKNSIKVRDKMIELTGETAYTTSFIDELISPFNKLKDDFARFIRYSEISVGTTVKEAREAYKHYNAVICGKERPRKSGFFVVMVDGKQVPAETESEYQERIAKEKADAPIEEKADAPIEEKADVQTEEKADAPIEEKADVQTEEKADAPKTEMQSKVDLLVESTKDMQVVFRLKKRNSKIQTLNINGELKEQIFSLLLAYNVITD